MHERRSLPPYEDELSLALLRSADHDEPSAAAYSKVATALGVSAAVGLGASLPAQALLAATSNGLSASTAARWSGSLFGKVVLVGVSSVLLVAGGVALRAHRPSSHETAPVTAHAPVAPISNRPLATNPSPALSLSLSNVPVPVPVPALSLSLSNVPVPVPVPALSVSNVPVPALPLPKQAAQSAAPALRTVRVAKASSLPEQVMSLDRARVALNSGDAGGALAEIAHYRSTWPRGVFLEEASVLEIEALAKRGEIVLAGMRAQAYVTAHPDSPQAERLRRLIPAERR